MTARTLTDRTEPVDPVLLEIIAGSLASIEKEVETAIARTSRSPMIRDAHDFRAGIHDRLLRKLTGRSYSSLVHPIVRDFPVGTMRPGDVVEGPAVIEEYGATVPVHPGFVARVDLFGNLLVAAEEAHS